MATRIIILLLRDERHERRSSVRGATSANGSFRRNRKRQPSLPCATSTSAKVVAARVEAEAGAVGPLVEIEIARRGATLPASANIARSRCVISAKRSSALAEQHVVVVEAIVGERAQRVRRRRGSAAGRRAPSVRRSRFGADTPAMQREHDAFAGDRQEAGRFAFVRLIETLRAAGAIVVTRADAAQHDAAGRMLGEVARVDRHRHFGRHERRAARAVRGRTDPRRTLRDSGFIQPTWPSMSIQRIGRSVACAVSCVDSIAVVRQRCRPMVSGPTPK